MGEFIHSMKSSIEILVVDPYDREDREIFGIWYVSFVDIAPDIDSISLAITSAQACILSSQDPTLPLRLFQIHNMTQIMTLRFACFPSSTSLLQLMILRQLPKVT
jgi:hypothetical protein